MKKLLTFVLLVSGFSCLSQTPNRSTTESDRTKEKIHSAISNYYYLDRESIYAHFDKDIFFTNESIWFKGYVFNKKNNTPYFETTNVYALLYDDDGKKLDEKLLFSYNGSFSGDFKLNKDLKSGRYHILFYTNFMNNFSENESAYYTVDVINESTLEYINHNISGLSKINVDFQPEGGNLISGITNNLGIHISDCNGNPIPVSQGNIINSKGENIQSFQINKSGYGKCYFVPSGESCKAVFDVNGSKVEAELPPAISKGIALEVNNYALPGKTIIRLKTNAQTINTLPGKMAMAVIQQNDKANIFDIDFNDRLFEKELVVANENFFPGTNTIRIIDNNLNQLAQRLVFELPEFQSELSLGIVKTVSDTISLTGKIAYPNANISISVLPENSVMTTTEDIYSAFLLKPYLNGRAGEIEALINHPTKASRYMIDLFLLNQKTLKYDWRDILTITPKLTYDFDIGLMMKGNLTSPLSDPKKYRIKANCPSIFLNDYSAIDEKNQFTFKNLIVLDESDIYLSLLEIPSVPAAGSFTQKIINRKRTFIKPLTIEKAVCPGKTEKIAPTDLPQFANNVIQLNQVELKGKPKGKLKYGNQFGNGSLRGYKVTEMDHTLMVLDYIGKNGFNVSNYGGKVTISGRISNTLITDRNSKVPTKKPNPTPEVQINGRRLLTFDELADIQMQDVDEIYLNPHAIVASMNNNAGIIKIYLKKIAFSSPAERGNKFTVTDGFARTVPFENPPIVTTSGSGFEKYGVVQWIPNVITSETGGFTFKMPKTEQKTVKIRIQGFTSEGKLISETMALAIP